MSSFLKIAIPSALVGGLLVAAGFELGRRRAEPPAPAATTTAAATAAPSEQPPPPPGPRFGGPDCACAPGTFFDVDTKECTPNRPKLERCSPKDDSEPVRACNGVYFGNPCMAILSGLKRWEKATAEDYHAALEKLPRPTSFPASTTPATPAAAPPGAAHPSTP